MEYEEFWSEQKEAYVKVIDIQIAKCGELTFVNGFTPDTFVALMHFFTRFDNFTRPDLCMYNNNNTTINVTRTTIYGKSDVSFWNGTENEIYLRENHDNRLFISADNEPISYVTLVWLPSRLQVYCLFEELNLFDEINLIDVILNFLTFKR